MNAIQCSENDIEGLLIHCPGCYEAFHPEGSASKAVSVAERARDAHERTCVAARDRRIEEILERQAADDEARAARQRGEVAP